MMKRVIQSLSALAVMAAIAACQNTAPGVSPTTMPSTGNSGNMGNTGNTGNMGTMGEPTPPALSTGEYVQTERLARPAINEGLILTPALLDTWNSVPPSADTTPAAKPIADEATAVLKALGNTDTQVNALFTALLPDVMRIDISRPSGYAGTMDAPLANVEPTKGIPGGGRMIKDDVIDTTFFLIVPEQTAEAVPNLRSDFVAYDKPDANGHVHKPVLNEFPYLPAPN